MMGMIPIQDKKGMPPFLKAASFTKGVIKWKRLVLWKQLDLVEGAFLR
jgi:hypothetical protein